MRNKQSVPVSGNGSWFWSPEKGICPLEHSAKKPVMMHVRSLLIGGIFATEEVMCMVSAREQEVLSWNQAMILPPACQAWCVCVYV